VSPLGPNDKHLAIIISGILNKRIEIFSFNPFHFKEVSGGFEPPYTVLQTAA
jgi:hypothetical protein